MLLKEAPEPALHPAWGSPVGGMFLLGVWAIQVSLSPSGKNMRTRQRSMGELCVMEFLVCMASRLAEENQRTLLPVSCQTVPQLAPLRLVPSRLCVMVGTGLAPSLQSVEH